MRRPPASHLQEPCSCSQPTGQQHSSAPRFSTHPLHTADPWSRAMQSLHAFLRGSCKHAKNLA
eukprot:9755857-Alexandrium_andersonii.AAC.1